MGYFPAATRFRPLHLAIAAAACGVVVSGTSFAFAAPAGDPPGANGTVKIDSIAFDEGIDNEPHVTCEFRVNFFNFDDDERANIVFTAHPPTGAGTELLRRNNQLVSDDPAGGGAPDPDESYAFSASQLGLDAYTPHPKQGYHVKVTIERIGAPGAGKHKVIWVAPCITPGPTPTSPAASPTSPSPSPSPTSPTPSPTSPAPSSPAPSSPAPSHTSVSPTTTVSPSPTPSGSNSPHPTVSPSTTGAVGGDLATTGTAVGGIVVAGASMVLAGIALMAVRRRRATNDLTEP